MQAAGDTERKVAMTHSLPPKPSLRYLHEEAKDLLKAQRHRDAGACKVLRLLRRFKDAGDQEILAAEVALHEAQFALALEYGFDSWSDLVRHVRATQAPGVISLDAVRARAREEIPEYAGAGVPLGLVAALNHAGADIDFMDFVATSGWAFSFGYVYDDISTAFLAVRGNPENDGPYEVFGFVPERLGYTYKWAWMRDKENLWTFVREHVDKGTPIVSEFLDGGLVTAYRVQDGRREVYYDQTAGAPGWLNIEDMNQPGGPYVLARTSDGAPWDRIVPEALRRAVRKGAPHEWGGAPQGLAALKAYLADVRDPAKDFASRGEWFCWATFSRLGARKCAAVWLESLSRTLPRAAGKHLSSAAGHYRKAFAAYEQNRSTVAAGEPTPLTLQQRARTPERIAVIAPILAEGIEAESAGLTALENAVSVLG